MLSHSPSDRNPFGGFNYVGVERARWRPASFVEHFANTRGYEQLAPPQYPGVKPGALPRPAAVLLPK